MNHKQYHEMIYQSKSHENEVLHMFLALFGKNKIFDYLTLKLTFDIEDDLESLLYLLKNPILPLN